MLAVKNKPTGCYSEDICIKRTLAAGGCYTCRSPEQRRQRAGAQHQSCYDENEEGGSRLWRGGQRRRWDTGYRLGQLRCTCSRSLLISAVFSPRLWAYVAAKSSPGAYSLTRMRLHLFWVKCCSLLTHSNQICLFRVVDVFFYPF